MMPMFRLSFIYFLGILGLNGFVIVTIFFCLLSLLYDNLCFATFLECLACLL